MIGSLSSFSQAEPQTVALAPGNTEDVLFLSAYNLIQEELTVSTAVVRISQKNIELIQDLGIQVKNKKVSGTCVFYSKPYLTHTYTQKKLYLL